MPFVHRLLLMSDSEVESELESAVAGTVMPDYLALMMGDVAMTPDLGPLAPHHFDDRTCFPTCMRTWSQGRSRLLATLDVWSNNKVLETKSVASLGIDNVLIALPFVQAVFQRYGYTAVIEPHKTKQSGSHGRNHVRFVVNSRRHKAKAGWGGYVYHGAEWTVGKPLLYRTSIKFDKEHAAQMHLGRFVVQLISAAYLQGCPPDPCTASAARDDFERRVLGHTCRQVTILVPRYGVPAGTVADVECGDEKNHGLKVWAKVDTKADKFVTLLFNDKGTFWQWRDNVVERMPGLTGTILGGVLGQQGGQSCTALVNGAPVLLSVDREPGGPLVLKGAKHRGQPVVGFEVKAGTWADGLQGGLRAMLPRWAVQQPGVAEVWAITSAVVDDGCLVSLILHDGRLLEIPPDKRSMSVKFEQECATLACAPIDQHLHRDEPFLHLGQSMGLHDHLLDNDESDPATTRHVPPPPPQPFALLVQPCSAMPRSWQFHGGVLCSAGTLVAHSCPSASFGTLTSGTVLTAAPPASATVLSAAHLVADSGPGTSAASERVEPPSTAHLQVVGATFEGDQVVGRQDGNAWIKSGATATVQHLKRCKGKAKHHNTKNVDILSTVDKTSGLVHVRVCGTGMCHHVMPANLVPDASQPPVHSIRELLPRTTAAASQWPLQSGEVIDGLLASVTLQDGTTIQIPVTSRTIVMRMQPKALLSLVPAAPNQRAARSDEAVLMAALTCRSVLCTHCPFHVADKHGIFACEEGQPLAVSLGPFARNHDVDSRYVSVRARTPTRPIACPVVKMDRPSTECSTSYLTHRPICLDHRFHLLCVPVVWVVPTMQQQQHQVVLYSTCPEHCPGHVVELGAFGTMWHSLDMLVRHWQAKHSRDDQAEDRRDARQKRLSELIELQKRQRKQIKFWASRTSLARLPPDVAHYIQHHCQRHWRKALDGSNFGVHDFTVEYLKNHWRFDVSETPSPHAIVKACAQRLRIREWWCARKAAGRQVECELSEFALSHIRGWCLAGDAEPDAYTIAIHLEVLHEMQCAHVLFRPPPQRRVLSWPPNSSSKRRPPSPNVGSEVDALLDDLTCGCKPAWEATLGVGLGLALEDIHALEAVKRTFRTTKGHAADPVVIVRLAYLGVPLGRLFEQGHPSGWWMLKHLLADGDVDNDTSRRRDVSPCLHLVYEFVLHIQRAWDGYGWYMGWKIVRLLRSAFGCPALVMPHFPGMTTSNRRAISALRQKPDEIFSPRELCAHLGLPHNTCVLRLELMICSAWMAYLKCADFDVASASFNGRWALAVWIEQHKHLYEPPPPASNAVWVDAVELLSCFKEHLPRLKQKPSFGQFMRSLYVHEWLVRADPLVCPDVQSLLALVHQCRQRNPHKSQSWFCNREVMAYAVRGALLGSPTRIAAMARAVAAIGPPPHTHCTNDHASPNCGSKIDTCGCCRERAKKKANGPNGSAS